jgi:hypothetical protein
MFARSFLPGDDPASMPYVVGAHPLLGACQVSVTVEPVTVDARPKGAPGAPLHGIGPVPPPTVTMISLDAPLTPDEFFALTRT